MGIYEWSKRDPDGKGNEGFFNQDYKHDYLLVPLGLRDGDLQELQDSCQCHHSVESRVKIIPLFLRKLFLREP